MDYNIYDYEVIGEEEWPGGWPRDVKIDEAREELVKFFNKNDRKVYYLQQLEVFFEIKPFKFYHWITAKAVNELIEEGKLGEEESPLGKNTKVKFVFNKKFRDHKMTIRKCMKVIKKYANPVIAIALFPKVHNYP